MSLKFAKLHGLGNNYIYLDLVTQQTSFTNWEQLAKAVSDINFGIGSDGLILILPGSNGADFRMRMFNSDGSEGRMCGNGIRCLAKYVYDNGLTKNECINVDTLAGRLQLSLQVVANRVEQVRVNMGAPRLTRNELPMSIGDPNSQCLNEPLEVANQMVHITAVSMGNPHAIIFVDNVQTAPVTTLGPLIENHPAFPDRTNVEFIEVVTPQHLKMRVWERGSGETMACGTGACASTVAAILLNKASRYCQVQLLGGTLDVEWAEDGDVYMTGPATYVADGHFCQQWFENV
jgi:diaminopimelate epimerase